MIKKQQKSQQNSETKNPLNAEEVSEFILEDAKSEPQDIKSLYQKEERFIIIEKVAAQLEQNRDERVKYAKRTFVLTCFWIFIVLAIAICTGVKINGDDRLLNISDKVIIVLITTTTINVFGFFLLVMQFLFNKREMATVEFLFNKKNDQDKTPTPKQKTKKKPLKNIEED